MAIAVRLGIVALVALLVVLGFRAKADIDLADRMNAYREGARSRLLAPRRSLDSIPTEDEVLDDAEALGTELRLTVSDMEIVIERDVAPEGYAGAHVADELGAVRSADVDESGHVRPATPRTLRTNRLTFTCHLHGEGFLVTRDEDVRVTRELGYAL